MKINFEKMGKVCMWITFPVMVFFFSVIVYGVYMGATGQQEFTLEKPTESIEPLN